MANEKEIIRTDKEFIKSIINEMGEAGEIDDKWWPNPSLTFYYAFLIGFKKAASIANEKNQPKP